jgi:hypothetical protein
VIVGLLVIQCPRLIYPPPLRHNVFFFFFLFVVMQAGADNECSRQWTEVKSLSMNIYLTSACCTFPHDHS